MLVKKNVSEKTRKKQTLTSMEMIKKIEKMQRKFGVVEDTLKLTPVEFF